jgi:hypothetical protein
MDRQDAIELEALMGFTDRMFAGEQKAKIERAGWDLHPLESAAFARRTPGTDVTNLFRYPSEPL